MKATKHEANYRGGSDEHRCKNCTMFRAGRVSNTCTSVRGEIGRNMLCDYFEAKGEHDGKEWQ